MNKEGVDNGNASALSPWSLQIAKVAGIPIRLHFTFVLFLAWIALVGNREKSYLWPLLVLAVFGCVLLHELGHALVGRRCGIGTKNITLYPIGGLAVLESRPNPRQELRISIAGPLVNLVIAIILALILSISKGPEVDFESMESGRSFLGTLLLSNLALAFFNLVPAFPMDGGRVLRASLALRMSEQRATQIAATIGQGLAIGFGVLGLFTSHYILMLIALFVFLGAGDEANATVTRSFLDGHTVRDAMQTRYCTITHGQSLEAAAKLLLSGSQHDFPVVVGEETVGILTRRNIAQGIASGGPTMYVSDVMERNFKEAASTLGLTSAFELFRQGDQDPVLVVDEGTLVGLLTSENISEFIMLEAAKAQSKPVMTQR